MLLYIMVSSMAVNSVLSMFCRPYFRFLQALYIPYDVVSACKTSRVVSRRIK